MSLEQTINSDIKAAMLAKDKKKLDALRSVKSAILLAKTDKGSSAELAVDTEMKILQNFIIHKAGTIWLKRKASSCQSSKKYLPEQMSEDDVKKTIDEIITETGTSSMKDMGKVMGMASKKLAGKADNKLIASLVKELLS